MFKSFTAITYSKVTTETPVEHFRGEMVVLTPTSQIHITREQAMEFFGLVPAPAVDSKAV